MLLLIDAFVIAGQRKVILDVLIIFQTADFGFFDFDELLENGGFQRNKCRVQN